MILEKALKFERIEEVQRLKYGFVTGAAGRGKTRLVQEIMKHNPRCGYLTATTGVAAIKLGDSVPTVFALLKCNNVQDFREAFQSGSLQRSLSSVKDGFKRLVIDECSMLLCEIFSLIYRACKEVELGLILIGDFLQLPPVIEKQDVPHTPKPWLIFKSRLWPEFTDGKGMTDGKNIIRLEVNHRTSDPGFIEFLDALRIGDGQKAEALASKAGIHRTRINYSIDEHFKGGLTLVAQNNTCQQINVGKYNLSEGREFRYLKKYYGTQRLEWKEIPYELKFRIGNRVMITRNKYTTGGYGTGLEYANGTTGEISYLTDKFIQVLCDNHKLVRIERHEEDNSEWYWEYTESGKEVRRKTEATAGVSQFPVCLSWCTTTHKAQGLTLPRAQVYLDDWMLTQTSGNSLLYVAASRCQRGSDLYLTGGSNLTDVCHIDPECSVWS